ncbi:hypothetical protein ACFYO2_02960 [Streptomyces sp. NPDC006602]|uniref:hypothetical protein n=1 Tax=Streptomyces sp. NPDC006602 TaxID=3364751 RepID=UPI0036AD41B6
MATPTSALKNTNVLLPALYGVLVVLTAVFASGTVTTIVAVAGAVLLGAYYATTSRRTNR